MKAIQLTAFGGPEVMTISEIADPIPGANEELINVTSIGINYADTHQIENGYYCLFRSVLRWGLWSYSEPLMASIEAGFMFLNGHSSGSLFIICIGN